MTIGICSTPPARSKRLGSRSLLSRGVSVQITVSRSWVRDDATFARLKVQGETRGCADGMWGTLGLQRR